MYMAFKDPVRFSAIKKLDQKLHITLVGKDNGASDYCMKTDSRVEGPIELGTRPVRRNNKQDWEEVKKAAMEGRMDDIPADIYIKHF